MRTIGYIYGAEGVVGTIMEDRTVISDTPAREKIGHVEGMNVFDRRGQLVGHLVENDGEQSAGDDVAAALLK
jgi:hypothetical protein